MLTAQGCKAKGTDETVVRLCSAHQAMCPDRRLPWPEGKDTLLPFSPRRHMGRGKPCIYAAAGYPHLVSDKHLKCCITNTEPLISGPLNLLIPVCPFSVIGTSTQSPKLDSSWIAVHLLTGSKSISTTFNPANPPVLCGRKGGHKLNLKISGEAWMVAQQTQRPTVTT